MQNNFDSGIESVIPIALLIMKSGTFQDQHVRSWDFVGSYADINSIADNILKIGATSINSDLITSSAPNILSNTGASYGVVPIANGWGREKGIFVLQLDVVHRVGTRTRWIIQGYTDQPAFSASAIDPNMLFSINTVYNYSQVVGQRNGVARTSLAMLQNYQMISPTSPAGVGSMAGGNWLLRPEDVMSNISNGGLLNHGLEVTDTSQLAGVGLQTSRSSNNIPSRMLSETLNHWHNSSNEISTVATNDAIAEAVFSKITEQKAEADLFIGLLARHNNGFGNVGSNFTFGQLEKAIPGIMRVYQGLQAPPKNIGVSNSMRENSDPLGGSGPADVIGANLHSIIPSIMTESLLSTVNFTMTNANGQLEISPSGAIIAFASDIDVVQWNIFKSRMIREIAPMFISKGYLFLLTVSSTFFHETRIVLKMDNDYYEKTYPSFASATFTPVQTPSFDIAKGFAKEFETVAGLINDAMTETEIRKASKAEASMTSLGGSIADGFIMPPQTLDVTAPSHPAPLHHSVGTTGPMGQALGMGLTRHQPAQSAPISRPGSMMDALKSK